MTTPPDISAYLAQPTEPELELLKLHRPNSSLTIFDIGSCEGEDSIRYARRFPRAKVFAFEPLPSNQELVRANLAKYAASSVELVGLALSDQTGEAVFHVSSGRPGEEFAGKDWNYGNKSSSLLPPSAAEPMYGWVRFEQAITVATRRLDDFCAERKIGRIDFIHMDVQGAEHLVLAGATAMLPRIGAIWLEVSDQKLYAGQKLRSEMEALLRSHGFAKSLEVRREVEGDQFYVNLRSPRNLRHLLRRRIARVWAGLARR